MEKQRKPIFVYQQLGNIVLRGSYLTLAALAEAIPHQSSFTTLVEFSERQDRPPQKEIYICPMIEISHHYLGDINDQQLWIGRMGNPNGPPILLIHGAIENSRIFYSEKGKGIAPFLAEAGFDVFVTDLRGKGRSTPLANSKKVGAGQFEVITQDIPTVLHFIKSIKGSDSGIHLMAHSWGGVLVASWFARFYKEGDNIRSMIFFASKRKIYVQHIKRWFMVDLMWTGLGSIATKLAGYLPAKTLKMGSDDEPAKFYFQCNKWVYSKYWIDPVDKFNYNQAFKKVQFPPILSLTGISDHSLGNKYCVGRMLAEMAPENLTSLVLSKVNGNLHNYDHINILTHPDAPKDHFPTVLNWLNQHN